MGTSMVGRQILRQNGHALEPGIVRGGQKPQAKVAFIAGLRGEELRVAVAELSSSEVLSVLESGQISRVVGIAIVSKLHDLDLLVSIACSMAASYIRRNALQRLDELQQDTPLGRERLERLTSCLRVSELFAYTVALMDAADFDWCARCDESVADAMCAALYGSDGMHEEVLVEDAFAQLAHCRPDLEGSLRACSPERFLPQALQPSELRTITLVDVTRCDNVA